MRNRILIFLAVLICSLLPAVTIYEIQYTPDAGNGSYPSPYAGQTVTTTGIVTAIGYNDGSGYYISMPEGGAYKGLFVYDNTHLPQVGDELQLGGQVWEYYGWTELRSITAYTLVSSGNTTPLIEIVTTTQAASEPFESVLCQVQNATVNQGFNQYYEWVVNDGSGDCMVAGGFFDQQSIAAFVAVGNAFDFIRGVVSYSFGTFRLNPRYFDDLLLDNQGVVITLPTLQTQVSSPISIPVSVSALNSDDNYTTYHFSFGFNPQIISYQGSDLSGTLSAGGNLNVTPTAGNLAVNYTGAAPLSGQGQLLKLNFTAVQNGSTELNASSFFFNTTPVTFVNQGMVTVGSAVNAIGDTITVIQRPLLNIPAIVIPGESFNIECVAPQSTTNWTASLLHEDKTVDMTISSASYLSNPTRWVLSALVPNVNVFELYDLQVSAAGGIEDITRNAVQVLPTRKTNYYFAHVTDSHMPTHIFYPDAGYDTDSTEVVDFREIIKDLNIIRPEFLLFTGDAVNDGELEEFSNRRAWSTVQRVLTELEIPVYLVSGNHDLGGWDSTPPPDGTSRRNWWRFFGWKWLDNPSTAWSWHTQDYSFDYGDVHYTGMESYIAYDDYWSIVYGAQSFTPTQMQWLNADLAASDASTKVLFDHYDFGDQLNLTSMGVDLNLWGHIHRNSGSITSAPYNLATESTCDGNRAYRIVRVTGTTLTPLNTLYAGNNGSQISLSYSPNNYGAVDSVYVSVVNNQPVGFEYTTVKVNMPAGNADYAVTGATLEQVDRSGDHNVCYLRLNLLPNSTASASIRTDGTAIDDENQLPIPDITTTIYPNPFADHASIGIKTTHSTELTLKVYNLKGELIKNIYAGKALTGLQTYTWDAKDNHSKRCPAGIYLLKTTAVSGQNTQKLLLLK